MLYIDNMKVSFLEQVKIICDRQGITRKELASRLGCTPQNLANKFARDNFTNNDMEEIAQALGYDLVIELREKPGKR